MSQENQNTDQHPCDMKELQEDCLINMLRLSDGSVLLTMGQLAEYMKAQTAEIEPALKALDAEGMILVNGDGIALTDAGQFHAREIRKKHHVMESFLINVLGMDACEAHREAHKSEHLMTQEYMQKLCGETGNKQDKDCSSCNNPCNNAISIGVMESLHDMKTHTKGKIAYLQSKIPEEVKKLLSMGFVPGREIEVESRISANGPRVVILGESTVAVDAELSKAILVNVGA